MRALLVTAVLAALAALPSVAVAAPLADHGAVGISTARRAMPTVKLDAGAVLERASLRSGPTRRIALLPAPGEAQPAAHPSLSPTVRSVASMASMVRVSSSSGAVRITF